MANETLSPKQASEIINKCSDILEEVENQVTRKSEEFLLNLSKSWEDEHAVEFAGKLQQTIATVISSVESNMQTLAEQVKTIAEGYGKVGGNAVSISAFLMKKTSDINISMVQSTFADGESGDEFGFRDPSTDPENLFSSFTQLKNTLSQISSDAVSQIKSINAFGNETVKNNLAKSSGKVVTILENAIYDSKRYFYTSIVATINDYLKAGNTAVVASLLPEGSSIPDVDNIDISVGNPSTYYGGVPKPDVAENPAIKPSNDPIGNPSTFYGGVNKPIDNSLINDNDKN